MESSSSAVVQESDKQIVVPGDYIIDGAGFTAGHGTYEHKDEEGESAS